jgi:Family of unknown function (DUF5372)
LPWLTVTHPFHLLAGRCLAVLFTERRAGCLVLVCDDGTGEWVRLPLAWTDRGPAAGSHRLAIEGLVELIALVGALAASGRGSSSGATVEAGNGEDDPTREEADHDGSGAAPHGDGDGAGEHGGCGAGRRV